MSKYTTEVRFICETEAGFESSQGYGKVEDIINDSWRKIFDFDFPIYDEAYRSVICKKILMHYYTREIGAETVGLWKLRLRTKMNEIMPYYNKMYEAELYKFNPFYDADYTRTTTGEESGDNSRSNNASESHSDGTTRNRNGSTWNVYSDTPQGALVDVSDETYLTDARKITENLTDTANNSGQRALTGSESGEFSTNKEYIEHVIGKFPGKSYSSLITEYRKSLVNIDMMIIDELKGLFMLLW